jgi:hypothetical protein
MSGPLVPRVGGILSADIAVPEHERELRFYSRILTTGDNPLWRDDLMNNLGRPIIGLGERRAEYAHLPLQWMPHIQVADVAASAKRALDLGGSELRATVSAAGSPPASYPPVAAARVTQRPTDSRPTSARA